MRRATHALILAASLAVPCGLHAETDPYTEGMRAFADESYEAAIQDFQAALERRPGFPPYNYMLAMSYLRSGQRDLALDTFRAVAEHAETDSELAEKAYVNLLRTLVDAERYEEVEAAGAKARQRLTASAEILNQIGRARLNRGDNEGAIEILTQATGLDASSWTIYNNLGLAYLNAGNYKGAMHAFERAADLNRRLPFIYNNLGVAHERLKQFDQASSAYERALDLDPNYKKARLSLKRVQRIQARTDQGQPYVLESESSP